MNYLLSLFSKDCSQFSLTDYNYYTCLAREYGDKLYSQLPDSNTILEGATAFLYDYKEWLFLAGSVIVTTYLAIRHYKNLPHAPKVTLRSSLDVADLTIEAAKIKKSPPHASITFCIDSSGSMAQTREKQVKEGIIKVLDSALKVVQATEGAQISIAMVTFNEAAKTICNPVNVTPKNIHELKSKINSYTSNGGTSIMAGLEEATKQVEESAKIVKDGVHTLILLTDGDDHKITTNSVKPCHDKLKKLGTQLFAIGVGDDHKAETLKAIAPSEGNFIGTYITTTESTTIEEAISRIYKQTVGVYTTVGLTTSQLKPGQWSLDGIPSGQGNNLSNCPITAFSEEHGVIKKEIKINRDKFENTFDLSTLYFELVYKDPQGRSGSIKLPWSPNTIIDPKIVNKV